MSTVMIFNMPKDLSSTVKRRKMKEIIMWQYYHRTLRAFWSATWLASKMREQLKNQRFLKPSAEKERKKESPSSRWVYAAEIRKDASDSSFQRSNRSRLSLVTSSAAGLDLREIRMFRPLLVTVLLLLLTPSVSTTSTFPFASSSICLWILRMASKLRLAFSFLHSSSSMRQKSGRETQSCGDDVNPQLWESEWLKD